MSISVSCQKISKSFGQAPLFSGISLGIDQKDRLGIIGPNGSGKSTFLKILAGLLEPDDGEVAVTKGSNISYCGQNVAFDPEKSIETILREARFQKPQTEDMVSAKIAQICGKIGFTDLSLKSGTLSGGWRKRLSIAHALVQEPDVLMLDEPTNHLDIEGILWLEKFLMSSNFTYAVISHDRYFLQNVTNRIVEINRVYPGGVFSVDGSYSEFLVKKAEFLNSQQQHQDVLANKMRREAEWLSRGPKARSTKQQARIQAAGKLEEELKEVSSRNRVNPLEMQFNASGRKTKKLIEVKGLEHSLADRALFRNLSMVLSPGMRIGLLGLNASGKSTLLKILANEISHSGGTVERADKLKVVYFDQNRESLDPSISLKKTLAPDSDSVVVGDRTVHVVTWARKFLFRPEQLDQLVGRLSGGEQARVQIARLLLQPADVLLLDEPTNDLDIMTLEILEESLTEFPGALVLVTHDRYMLDRVSNTILALDGTGGVGSFADYSQWQAANQKSHRGNSPKTSSSPSGTTSEKRPASKRLSYNEQREFDTIEERIEICDKAVQTLQSEVDDPAIASNAKKLQEKYSNLSARQDELEKLYMRWAELEEKQR